MSESKIVKHVVYLSRGGEFELETSEFVWIMLVGSGSGQRENSPTTPPQFCTSFSIFPDFFSANLCLKGNT